MKPSLRPCVVKLTDFYLFVYLRQEKGADVISHLSFQTPPPLQGIHHSFPSWLVKLSLVLLGRQVVRFIRRIRGFTPALHDDRHTDNREPCGG
jgi:hypothetical protein